MLRDCFAFVKLVSSCILCAHIMQSCIPLIAGQKWVAFYSPFIPGSIAIGAYQQNGVGTQQHLARSASRVNISLATAKAFHGFQSSREHIFQTPSRRELEFRGHCVTKWMSTSASVQTSTQFPVCVQFLRVARVRHIPQRPWQKRFLIVWSNMVIYTHRDDKRV